MAEKEEKKLINFGIWPWDEANAKPYFTNPEGFEWWIDKSSTQWAHRDIEPTGGKGAKNLLCFIVRKDEKPVSRVVMDKNTNEVVYENGNLEAVACWLDMYKVAQTIPEEDEDDE